MHFKNLNLSLSIFQHVYCINETVFTQPLIVEERLID